YRQQAALWHSAQYAGAAPLSPWAKSARKAPKFTSGRTSRWLVRAPGKLRGADPTGLELQGPPARSSVKRVEGRSHAGPAPINRVLAGLRAVAKAHASRG